MSLRPVLLGSILCLLAGCGQEQQIYDNPHLITDRDSLGFGLEYNSGAFVGTEVSDTLRIDNRGSQNLVISSVELTGDAVFRKDNVTSTTIAPLKYAFQVVYFKPTKVTSSEADDFKGQLVIHSNSETDPDKVITLRGRGVKP